MVAERIAAGLGLAVMVLGAVALAWDSHSRHQSQQREHKQPAVAKEEHRTSDPAVADAAGKEATEHQHKGGQKSSWQDKFLDHLPDWFVALFTGLLTLVTARLVRSTNKLWDAGERQIAVAKEAADAAKLSASAAKASADAVASADRAYVKMSHERPGIQLDEAAGVVAVRVHIKNFGRTPADVIGMNLNGRVIFPPNALPAIPDYIKNRDRRGQAFLVANDEFWVSCNLTTADLGHIQKVKEGAGKLYLVGYVDYRDRLTGLVYRGGYARIYDTGHSGNNLRFLPEPNYNFDRVRLPSEDADWDNT